MFKNKNLTIRQNILLLLWGIATSFISYCIFQLIELPIIPLSIIPIAIFVIKHNEIPFITLFIIGIFDDILLNAVFGLHSIIYLVLSHTAIDENNQKTNLTMFLILYILINSILFIASRE